MFDVWIGDVELTSLTINLAIAVFLPIQLLLCFKAKKRIIRLLPVIVLAVLTVAFFIMAIVAQGWEGLGYLFFAIYTGITLFMCGIGWGIWWIVKRCKQREDLGCSKKKQRTKKEIILKVISVVLVLVTILAIICAITVTGSGVLDLSDIARGFFIGVAVICGILAVVAWTCSKPKK